MGPIRVRRSVLFVPGSHARALEKARTLACDVVALDLEDSVAPEAKDAARHAVLASLKQFGAREVVVRINPLSTPWGATDLAAIAGARPDAILLPKVTGPADIAAAQSDVPLWAMIETAPAVLNLAAIAAGEVEVLMVGTNDLLKEMGGLAMAGRENLWGVLSQSVLAARAHGLDIIDGTYNALTDEAGLEAECLQGRSFGFDGKTVIHPSQIAVANRVFAPTPPEIEAARRIVAAFAHPENLGKGTIALDGRMVEKLHEESARRVLARAEAIAARGG